MIDAIVQFRLKVTSLSGSQEKAQDQSAAWMLFIGSAIVCWIGVSIWSNTVNDTLKINKPTFTNFSSNQTVESVIPLPPSLGQGITQFGVAFDLQRGLLSPTVLKIIPDDCVRSLTVNGNLVDLSTLTSATSLCDWRSGFNVDLSSYLILGKNTLSMKIENIDGPYGLNVFGSPTDPRRLFIKISISLCGVLSFLLLVQGLRILARPGNYFHELRVGFETASDVKKFRICIVSLALVTFLSYLTIFRGYDEIKNPYWDENYHIVSAQKYLNQVYFMEPHPPLGKLLIAAGEYLFPNNLKNDHFLQVDHAKSFPEGFSFTGYRFFPALFGFLCVPILYLIFVSITGNFFWAIALASLFAFDNALVVHLRAAMLEGPLLFFELCVLLSFFRALKAIDAGKSATASAVCFGTFLGLALVTKVVALLFVLLIPVLLFQLRRQAMKAIRCLLVVVIPFALIYIGVWYVHFFLGQKVEPKLADQGYYQASPAFKQILTDKQTGRLSHFPAMLRDSLAFVSHYNAGVPSLKIGSPVENGSSLFGWPFGIKAISYRWDSPGKEAPRYVYLQSNPVGWLAGVLALVFVLGLVVAQLFSGLVIERRSRILIFTVSMLYIGYMAAIYQIPRAMYLYHYLTPLLFSWILLALVVMEIKQIGGRVWTLEGKSAFLVGLSVMVFACFLFFSPLTYAKPLTKQEFQARMWLKSWDLKCIGCE